MINPRLAIVGLCLLCLISAPSCKYRYKTVAEKLEKSHSMIQESVSDESTDIFWLARDQALLIALEASMRDNEVRPQCTGCWSIVFEDKVGLAIDWIEPSPTVRAIEIRDERSAVVHREEINYRLFLIEGLLVVHFRDAWFFERSDPIGQTLSDIDRLKELKVVLLNSEDEMVAESGIRMHVHSKIHEESKEDS